MSNSVDPHLARALCAIVIDSSHWKLMPEKKAPFKSVDEAGLYFEDHNEPLYLLVPFSDGSDHALLKVTTTGQDIIFESVSFGAPVQTRVNHSHIKLFESAVTDMLNNALPPGKKVSPL